MTLYNSIMGAGAKKLLEPVDPNAPLPLKNLTVNGASRADDTIKNTLAAISLSGLAPAWNELSQKAIFTCEKLPWDESFGREFTDHTARFIRALLIQKHQGNDFQPSKDNVFEAVMTIAYKNKFNPVVDYLEQVQPTWDGVERIHRLFVDYIPCGSSDYTEAVSRCFMIGAARRARHPGSKFDTMPVLKSPQGWNKSQAISTLFSAKWSSDADLGDLKNKDAAMLIRGIWVQEFAEIDSLTRAAAGTLKAFCSRSTDRIRDPHGRVTSDTPRRCVFIGTLNEGGYLKDATGSRRFWPLTLRERVDLATLERDRAQLWAEAACAEELGESDVLPTKLWAEAGKRQLAETSADPWEDSLRTFLAARADDYAAYENLDLSEEPPPPDKVHSRDLFEEIGIPVSKNNRQLGQRLRAVMEGRLN